MLVYVAGKYTAPTQEEKEKYIKLAEEYAQELLSIGFIPVIPHKNTKDWEFCKLFDCWTVDDWLERYCFPLLKRCDALFVSCGENDSYGVSKEVEFALKNNIPVIYWFEDYTRKLGRIVSEITAENRHREMDWGRSVGKEVINDITNYKE